MDTILTAPVFSSRRDHRTLTAECVEDIQSRAQPLERLADYNDAETVATTLAKWPQASGWVPLMARAQPMVVLLKDDNTDVLGIVALNPWP